MCLTYNNTAPMQATRQEPLQQDCSTSARTAPVPESPTEPNRAQTVCSVGTDAWDLPGVNLTRSDGFPQMTEAEWQDRDLLIGLGGIRGTVRMGQLMLDAGRNIDPRDEYELEGEIGFRGVSPGSCELRIWLPGSIAWGAWQPEVPLT